MPNGLFGYEKIERKVCSKRRDQNKKELSKYLYVRKWEEIFCTYYRKRGKTKRFRAWRSFGEYKRSQTERKDVGGKCNMQGEERVATEIFQMLGMAEKLWRMAIINVAFLIITQNHAVTSLLCPKPSVDPRCWEVGWREWQWKWKELQEKRGHISCLHLLYSE